MSTTTLTFSSNRLHGRASNDSPWRSQTRPSTTFRRNQNNVKFRAAKSLGPVAHTVLIGLMLAVLGLIYLTQVTKTSTYSYQINDLETRRDELASKKQDLQVENARLQALERVKQSDVAKALTSAPVEYATN